MVGSGVISTGGLLQQGVEGVLFKQGVIDAADKSFQVFIEQKPHVPHRLSEAVGIDLRNCIAGTHTPYGAFQLFVDRKPSLEEIELGLPLPVRDIQPFFVRDIHDQEADDRDQNEKLHALSQKREALTKKPPRFPWPWQPLRELG